MGLRALNRTNSNYKLSTFRLKTERKHIDVNIKCKRIMVKKDLEKSQNSVI